MISESIINVAANSGVSLVSKKAKDEEATSAGQSREDVEDKIDLGVAASYGDQLRNAESTDELLSLLKEGQAEARASFEKFRALQEERLYGESENAVRKAGDDLFNAVRQAVVDVLSADKSNPVDFRVALAGYLNGDK